MTEREYVIGHLARYADERPGLFGDALAGYLSGRIGAGWEGGAGTLRTGQPYRYSTNTTGIYIGQDAIERWNRNRKPDITWREVADDARCDRVPRQVSMWEVLAA